MATTFKTFLNNDVTTTKTLLHEAIPITGAIVSGTYGFEKGTETNIKNYSHGMFQSVFDYPYLSSSANHIFDISAGYSTNSNLSGNVKTRTGATALVQQAKKISMYNQLAQVLMGHDVDGNIQRFDRDGELASAAVSSKMDEVVFINFSRLLVKDEIKKGSFQLKLGTHPDIGQGLQRSIKHIMTIRDTNAQNDYRINSPAGEYGILSASHTAPAGTAHGKQGMRHGGADIGAGKGGSLVVSDKVGLIFYQAGVCVITASVFGAATHGAGEHYGGLLNAPVSMSIGGAHGCGKVLDSGSPIAGAGNTGTAGTISASIDQMLTGSKIQNLANNIRRRIYDVSFNNTTELNSTVYFCRANHNEFNYSANPTYLKDSEIVVKDVPADMPISYVTSVGLYSPDNELMACAKLSEPLRKDPTNELTLRVRLDY